MTYFEHWQKHLAQILVKGAGFGKKEFERLLAATCKKDGIVGKTECVLLNSTGRAIEALVSESISELSDGNFSVDELWSTPALGARALLAPCPLLRTADDQRARACDRSCGRQDGLVVR